MYRLYLPCKCRTCAPSRKTTWASQPSRLGVDYESFNPAALYFYPKRFDVYTNSVVRRIDERGNRKL